MLSQRHAFLSRMLIYAQAYQHCFHAPLSEIGRQCHFHPSGKRFKPVFSVWKPYSFAVVDSFVASFSKVPQTSVAWHTQSSSLFKCELYDAHSAHASAIVFSGCPGAAFRRLTAPQRLNIN